VRSGDALAPETVGQTRTSSLGAARPLPPSADIHTHSNSMPAFEVAAWQNSKGCKSRSSQPPRVLQQTAKAESSKRYAGGSPR
jgi:hypothetical protein